VRETRLHGSEGGGTETNRSFLPLSQRAESATRDERCSCRTCATSKRASEGRTPIPRQATIEHEPVADAPPRRHTNVLCLNPYSICPLLIVECPPMKVKNKWKALLLIPAASAGVVTALCFSYPPKETGELLFMLAFLAPFYLANLAVLGWMWWKSADRRYLGLTRGTWTALVAVAYLLGLSLMFAA
jgi:hypothetical protein